MEHDIHFGVGVSPRPDVGEMDRMKRLGGCDRHYGSCGNLDRTVSCSTRKSQATGLCDSVILALTRSDLDM